MSVSDYEWHTVRHRIDEFFSRKYVLVLLTVVPVVLLFAFINLLPIVWAISAGFYEINPFSPEWKWVGLANYWKILTDEAFWMSVYRAVLFSGGSVVLQVAAGTGLALLINRTFTFEKAVRAIVMLPYLIPTAVLALVALWMGNSQWGIVNGILVEAGLLDGYVAWYGNLDLAMLSVILTSSWKFSIFVTIMVLARLQSIPDGYYEAAEMAGAGFYQKFRDITLPNLKGVIFIVLLLRSIWMFNKFDIIWVLTRGGPGEATRTAPVHAYETAFLEFKLGEALAISTLLFVLLAVVAGIYFYVFQPAEEVRVE